MRGKGRARRGDRATHQEASGLIIDVVFRDEKDNVLGKLVANEKVFSTGSRGFYGQSKIEIAGKRYQASVQLVEIGSKESKEQKTAG